MKIVLITHITPASENIRGASALPYHLMIHRPQGIDILIYSFNNNKLSKQKIKEIEAELNVKIVLLSQPLWLIWVLKLHMSVIRVFLKFPIFNYIKLSNSIVEDIKSQKPDGIWIYGQDFSRISRQFPQYKRVHTLPDCESLFYYRMLGRRFVFKKCMSLLRNMLMYLKYVRMEGQYDNDKTIRYHLVGNADVESLRNINPSIQAYFLRHPHYHISEQKKKISFSISKIKLLVAGQYNLYMRQSADELVALLNRERRDLRNSYKITFLGHGWEYHVSELRNAGYEVKHIIFASDYIEEIIKHDVQLAPIAVGTGTKGKVLDAIANGLLVIGTGYALENIAVTSGISCVQYDSEEDLLKVLRNLPCNLEKYEQMAECGRKAVLEKHGRELIGKKLIALFND